jgi:CDP-6-deoxy-D-xylo-4-hexulose-3-dehydrase
MSKHLPELKEEILRLTREYSRLAHAAQRPGADTSRAPFIPGETIVPYAGRVFTEDEVEAAVSSSLDFWLTLGPEGEAMERELASFLGVKHSLLVNSGSSANLLALTALTSPKIPENRRLRPGDEVITCAAGFPTTVAPILQNGLVPVFIDNDPITGNAKADQLAKAFIAGKTKAVMMAHTLGNPFDLGSVLRFCRLNDLWLIEDNCDALGSTYSLPVDLAKELCLDHLLKLAQSNSPPTNQPLKSSTRFPFVQNGILTAYTGSFGDLSTQSFYPPHHITMGEGGAVNIVSHPPLKKIVESFRDWGRDCWCPSGKDNTCSKRFGWKLGDLPEGYDHKYIYSHLGYNLKPLDLQAAIGRVQLRRLPAFIQARKDNWNVLRDALEPLSDRLEFSLPTHATGWSKEEKYGGKGGNRSSTFSWDKSGCTSSPSWFGFMVRPKAGKVGDTRSLARRLDEAGIGNRMLFGGNLTKQPVFSQLRRERPGAFRVLGSLEGADDLMERALFVGVYPGMDAANLKYIAQIINNFSTEMKT